MITVDLGKRIRELRTQTGLSQEKFALKIGMDRTYFASVEAGKRNIAICNLKKICDDVADSEMTALRFSVKFPVDHILKAVKWLFIEQDIRYWNYSGKNMTWNIVPQP